MDSILSENVREYFFFDGEKMDDLTKPGNGKIEDAIRNIMHLPVIDKTRKHLDEVARDYRSELKRKGSSVLDELITKKRKITKELIQIFRNNQNSKKK